MIGGKNVRVPEGAYVLEHGVEGYVIRQTSIRDPRVVLSTYWEKAKALARCARPEASPEQIGTLAASYYRKLDAAVLPPVGQAVVSPLITVDRKKLVHYDYTSPQVMYHLVPPLANVYAYSATRANAAAAL